MISGSHVEGRGEAPGAGKGIGPGAGKGRGGGAGKGLTKKQWMELRRIKVTTIFGYIVSYTTNAFSIGTYSLFDTSAAK